MSEETKIDVEDPPVAIEKNATEHDGDDEEFTAGEPEEQPDLIENVETETETVVQAEGEANVTTNQETESDPEGPSGEDLLEAFPYREQPLEEPTIDDDAVLNSPTGSPAPPTYDTIDETTRREIHAKLRAYENRRRSAYTAKLESSCLYWRSFRDLLRASVHETARAERMVLGTAMANKAYAESMHASYEDVLLDDRGVMVNDPKKQKRLLDTRSMQAYEVAPLGKTEDGGKRATVRVSDERKNNMLFLLIESQQEIAVKFGENAETLGAEIATEIADLRKALAAKVTEIQLLGDTIIGELEKTEVEVTEAWGKQVDFLCVLVHLSSLAHKVSYRVILFHGNQINGWIQFGNQHATSCRCRGSITQK